MNAIARAAYRAWQFAQALAAEMLPWSPPDLSAHLGGAELSCFRALGRADQRHSVAVWQTLRDRGVEDPDLLRAALLHDVGKAGGRITLAHRVIHVLVRALAPGAWPRLAQGRSGTWRYAFHVQERHAAIGADLLQGLGIPATVVALVRHHHDEGELGGDAELIRRLALLRQADAAC